jgi:hypothetical protein
VPPIDTETLVGQLSYLLLEESDILCLMMLVFMVGVPLD